MTTAVMFSGIDGLDRLDQRDMVLALPEVKARMTTAQTHLDRITGGKISLSDFAQSSEELFHSDLATKALLCAVVHVGLYDRLLKYHPEPDYLVGCSLGDSARTVASGAMSFEQIMLSTYLFGNHGQKLTGGAVVCVKCRGDAATAADLREIESLGLYIAVYQTPKHFLVGGPEEYLQVWCELDSTRQKYAIRPLCDKPLHSAAMKATQQYTLEHFGELKIQPWKIPMISASECKLITNEKELLDDMINNMTGPVRWWPTYQWMVEELGVKRFINIGPNDTLIRFHERIPLATPVEVIDGLSLMQSAVVPALKSACGTF